MEEMLEGVVSEVVEGCERPLRIMWRIVDCTLERFVEDCGRGCGGLWRRLCRVVEGVVHPLCRVLHCCGWFWRGLFKVVQGVVEGCGGLSSHSCVVMCVTSPTETFRMHPETNLSGGIPLY